MTQIIPHSELLQRAVAHIVAAQKEHPERKINDIIDEAGMQFNLSPLDTEALLRLFSSP